MIQIKEREIRIRYEGKEKVHPDGGQTEEQAAQRSDGISVSGDDKNLNR